MGVAADIVIIVVLGPFQSTQYIIPKKTNPAGQALIF